MHTRRILCLLAPVLFASLALTLLWAGLPGRDSARAAQPSAELPPAPYQASPLEPRWLELVRSVQASDQWLSPQAGFTVNINLTGNSLAGTAPTLQEVTARVLRQDALIAQGAANPAPDPSGNFYALSLNWGGEPYPCPPDTCYAYGFEPGDQVWLEQGSTAISMTVPVLTAQAEPLEDTLIGQAPASAQLTAYILPFDDPSTVYTHTGSADPGGSYRLDLQAVVDLHRQDCGYVLIEAAPGRRAYRYFVAPLLRAQVGGNVISGVINPWTMVVITRTDGSGQVLSVFHASSVDGGEFSTEYGGWYEPSSPLARLNPGERLIASSQGQAFSMTIPILSAASDLANQRVSGQAAPGALLEARRYSGPLYLYPFFEQDIWNETPAQVVPLAALPDGSYAAALALQPGDYMGVFQTLPDEQQAYARSATPAIYARMNTLGENYAAYDFLIQGQVDQTLTPLTVTVQGPSGYYKDWRVLSAGSNGVFYFNSDYYSEHLVLDSGDVLRVASPSGEEIVFILPPLTADADADSATVFGEAPPGARLVVKVDDVYTVSPDDTLIQVVTASASGEYLADFSPVLQFYPDSTHGEVTLEDSQGYRASRTWSANGCPPRLLGAQVGGNRLSVSGDWTCSDAYIRLRNAQGAVKAETPLYYYSPDEKGVYQIDLYDLEGKPVTILTGDRVEITYLGEVAQSVVPALSVQVDTGTSLVSGQAPPGEQVSIELKRYDDYTRALLAVITATQSGAFQADLSATYAYETGDRIFATLSGNEETFYTLAIPPAMQVQLYSSSVVGWLPPLTPFTLRHTRGVTSTEQDGGVSETEGRFYAGLHDANYYQLYLAPGDQLALTAASVTYNLTMPTLTAKLDRQAARLSGSAPPYAHLKATISDSDDNSYAQITELITASAQGEYSLDFPQLLPLGDTSGRLTYLHPEGHQVYLDFSTPRWQVVLDTGCVGGSLPVIGAPAQVTLTKADGSWQETVDLPPTEYYGDNLNACFSRTVQSGDLLELSDNQGNQFSFRVPVLEARHDYVRQALIGRATPGAKVKAIFETRYAQVARTPWLEPDGSFGIDTSDLQLMFGIGNGGSVHLTDAQGNEVYRFFTITGAQVFLPVVPR